MLGAAAFWLIPDQKLVRAKLLAVQAVVLLAGGVLTYRGAMWACNCPPVQTFVSNSTVPPNDITSRPRTDEEFLRFILASDY